MMLNGTTRLVLLVCLFSAVAFGQDESRPRPDKCRSPPPRFRNMSSCCDIPNLIEESVLEECGIPTEQGVRFWLHAHRRPHHHHHGSGRFHHHGPHGEHHGPGCPHHGPGSGSHDHGWTSNGPHDPQGNDRGEAPPGADVKPAVAEAAPGTSSIFEDEWPLSGEESSPDADAESSLLPQLRRARRQPHHGHHGHHRHHGPPPCDKELCIFRKLNLLDKDEKVDTDAFTALLDQVMARDADWSGSKDAVVKECITKKDSHRPPGVCEPLHLLVCSTTHMFMNCPEGKWKTDENCSALKEHVTECHRP